MGWGDFGDRQLLDAMGGRFDVLVNVDSNLRHQQRLHGRPFAIVILGAKTHRFADLLPLVPALLRVLGETGPGEIHELSC